MFQTHPIHSLPHLESAISPGCPISLMKEWYLKTYVWVFCAYCYCCDFFQTFAVMGLRKYVWECTFISISTAIYLYIKNHEFTLISLMWILIQHYKVHSSLSPFHTYILFWQWETWLLLFSLLFMCLIPLMFQNSQVIQHQKTELLIFHSKWVLPIAFLISVDGNSILMVAQAKTLESSYLSPLSLSYPTFNVRKSCNFCP